MSARRGLADSDPPRSRYLGTSTEEAVTDEDRRGPGVGTPEIYLRLDRGINRYSVGAGRRADD